MTDLSYDCEFETTIVLDNWISPNKYKCKIYFDIETDDGNQQNIAFERCKVMLEGVFNNSMLISMHNPLLQTLAKKTKQRIIALPTEPLDVIVAAAIYSKLNAICEDRLLIDKVKISSAQADNIWVHFDTEFAEVFTSLECEYYKVVKDKPWWQRPDPATGDWFEVNKKDIKFHFQKASWEKDLQWQNTSTKNDNSPKSNWQPKVINGGKETKH